MAHIPERMCVVCRTHKSVGGLIRFSVNPLTNTLVPDTDAKSAGRGAYICRDINCIEKSRKKHIIERHLKCDTSDAAYVKAEGLI